MSGLASSIVDNIPFTATFIPVLQDISETTSLNIQPLTWALIIGAGLGGNGTVIGSSASIVATGVSASRGYPITFKASLKIGMLSLILSSAIANAVLVLRLLLGF